MSKFDKDSLGARMKAYEDVYKQKLVPKATIVIRVDGKAFHTFTKKMYKPFDDILSDAMQKTMLEVAKDLATCKFAYTQSDEITFVCVCDDPIKTAGLYDYKVNKIISIVASKTTKCFNKFFYESVSALESGKAKFKNIVDLSIYKQKLFEAEFDARVMNIPDFDVINNIIWRQQDATRNSIQMLAQSQFKHSELQGKNTSELMDMLILKRGINWNNLETYKKRGCCCYRKEDNGKKKWALDLEMPIITEEGMREKINDYMFGDRV